MRNICKFSEPVFPASLTVSAFILETDPAAMQERELLSTHRLLLMARGSGVLHCGKDSVRLSPGMLVFAFPGETHWVSPEKDCSYLYIHFSGSRANDLLRRFCICPEKRSFSGFEGLIPLWAESITSASDRCVDLAAESMLLYAFSRLSLLYPQRSGPVSQIVEITEAEFTDPTLSLASLAPRLGYNAKYLSHIFKTEMGVSYCQYLRTLRVKSAVVLFDHGLDSIKNVALLCGFSDPLYFSSIFKNSVGVPPSVYVAQVRQQANTQSND